MLTAQLAIYTKNVIPPLQPYNIRIYGVPNMAIRQPSRMIGTLGSGQSSTMPFRTSLDSKQLQALEAGTIYVFLRGLLQYTDIFGVRHTTEFCHVSAAGVFPHPFNMDPPDPLWMSPCESGNISK